MATDEELEAAFGVPRPPPRQHEITEDDWRVLMDGLEPINRVDRRVHRLCSLVVMAVGAGAAWAAGDLAMSHFGKGWAAAAIGFAAFLVVGVIGQRELDRDEQFAAWFRRRR